MKLPSRFTGIFSESLHLLVGFTAGRPMLLSLAGSSYIFHCICLGYITPPGSALPFLNSQRSGSESDRYCYSLRSGWPRWDTSVCLRWRFITSNTAFAPKQWRWEWWWHRLKRRFTATGLDSRSPATVSSSSLTRTWTPKCILITPLHTADQTGPARMAS